MSTIKVSNLQNASAASPAIVLDANSRATLNGLSYPTEGSLSGRNRIINGDMRIDQRNAGASVTATGSVGYTLDRWAVLYSQNSKFSVQRNAGSVTPPAGFTNYLGVTSLSAYSITSTDYNFINQKIEGYNSADLAWGTANAQSATLSFWVRSSLTGNFSGSLRNANSSRSYVFTYTINSANTWEYKTIVMPGETTGTWQTTDQAGIVLTFCIGSGSTRLGTAGSWQNVDLDGATGTTSVVGTNGATFYITGVQLEAGSVATPFERRSYGQELMLARRYYQVLTPSNSQFRQYVQNVYRLTIPHSVPMRIGPNLTKSVSGAGLQSENTVASADHLFIDLTYTGNGNGVIDLYPWSIIASAEL